VCDRLARAGTAEVSFNYLGQLDSVLRRDRWFSPASEAAGRAHAAANPRAHLIEINSAVAGGMLFVRWKYSANVHHHDTIVRVANTFLESLHRVIAHCQSTANTSYKAEDFSEFSWNQQDVDRITAAVRHKAEQDTSRP
jgi:non-ribosomal peptide synthase protein (TIGR01720 family)